jgi:hypothetical protein
MASLTMRRDVLCLPLNEVVDPFYALHKIRPDSVNGEETH